MATKFVPSLAYDHVEAGRTIEWEWDSAGSVKHSARADSMKTITRILRAPPVITLAITATVALVISCSNGRSLEEERQTYDELADECVDKAAEENREAQRILDTFGTTHGGGRDPDFVEEYLQLEKRLKDPIDAAFERCLDEARENSR